MGSSNDLSPRERTRNLLDVSVTERSTWRNCHRRWHLEVVEGLEPLEREGWAREFGSGMHAALESYYWEDGDAHLAHKVLREWYVGWSEQDLGEEERAGLNEIYEIGEGMLENYPVFEQQTKVDLGEVVAVEGRLMDKTLKTKPPKGYPKATMVILDEVPARLLVPIVDPRTKKPLPGQPYLSARIDLLSRRATPKKGLWVVDHKTSATQFSSRGLDFDDQITGYCYVVWRWLGLMPRGAIYNGLIKQNPKPPRVLSKPKYGSTLSTAKDQLTTADLYRDALKEHGLLMPGTGRVATEQHADCLNALLARGWDPFFQRLEALRNEDELLSFERRLFEEYTDMVDHMESEVWYPNPSVRMCPTCSVNRICQAMEDGSDVVHIVETMYQEAEDRKARR